jgi:hypothetical protein
MLYRTVLIIMLNTLSINLHQTAHRLPYFLRSCCVTTNFFGLYGILTRIPVLILLPHCLFHHLPT